MWIVLSVNSGHLGEFGLPGGGEASRSASRQWLSGIIVKRNAVLLHRPDQPHAALDLAVIEHQARRRDLHGGAARLRSLTSSTARGSESRSSASSSVHRPIALALRDGEQAGLRAGAGMGVDRRAGR